MFRRLLMTRTTRMDIRASLSAAASRANAEEIAASTRMTVHTGPKAQSGGFHDGFLSW